MEIQNRACARDLLDGKSAGSVDVAVDAVVEEQRQFFACLPCQIAGAAGDRLGCAQPVSVVGIGIFDGWCFAAFGSCDRGQVAGLVIAIAGGWPGGREVEDRRAR
jgi:hypothetical protein